MHLDTAVKAMKKFTEELSRNSDHQKYISGIAVIGSADDATQKNQFHRRINYHIRVCLYAQPPAELQIPTRYDGVQIDTHVLGAWSSIMQSSSEFEQLVA